MTSPSKFAPMPGFRRKRGRSSFTQATASLTCRPPKRPTCYLPKRDVVCYGFREIEKHYADLLTDLVTYCENEKVPFTTFNSFADIHKTVQDIVAGKLTVQEAATGRK